MLARQLPLQYTLKSLKLDCPSDGHWDYAGMFAVEVEFQIRDQFWIPPLKLHKSKYLFFKPQNGLVALVFAKRCFQVFFGHKIGLLSSNRFFSGLKVYYERKSSTRLRIFEKFKKTIFRTKLLLGRASMILSNARRSA